MKRFCWAEHFLHPGDLGNRWRQILFVKLCQFTKPYFQAWLTPLKETSLSLDLETVHMLIMQCFKHAFPNELNKGQHFCCEIFLKLHIHLTQIHRLKFAELQNYCIPADISLCRVSVFQKFHVNELSDHKHEHLIRKMIHS